MGYVPCPSVCKEVYLTAPAPTAPGPYISADGAWGGAWWRFTVCFLIFISLHVLNNDPDGIVISLGRGERLFSQAIKSVSYRQWWVENQALRPWELTWLLSSLLSGVYISQVHINHCPSKAWCPHPVPMTPLLIQCLGQCSLYFTQHWGLQGSERSVRSTWDTQELTAVAKKMLHFLMVFMEKYPCTWKAASPWTAWCPRFCTAHRSHLKSRWTSLPSQDPRLPSTYFPNKPNLDLLFPAGSW